MDDKNNRLADRVLRILETCDDSQLREVNVSFLARLLNVEDVDLENGKLAIRQSKGNKDRNVIMSEAVLDLCRIYHTKVSGIFPGRK